MQKNITNTHANDDGRRGGDLENNKRGVAGVEDEERHTWMQVSEQKMSSVVLSTHVDVGTRSHTLTLRCETYVIIIINFLMWLDVV